MWENEGVGYHNYNDDHQSCKPPTCWISWHGTCNIPSPLFKGQWATSVCRASFSARFCPGESSARIPFIHAIREQRIRVPDGTPLASSIPAFTINSCRNVYPKSEVHGARISFIRCTPQLRDCAFCVGLAFP